MAKAKEVIKEPRAGIDGGGTQEGGGMGLWPGYPVHTSQLYLRTLFNLFLSPLPPGGPGEGPDCHFPMEIGGVGPIPARIRGTI